MQPAASSQVALARMRRQGRQDTGPEIELRRELHRRGLRFRLHLSVVPGTRRSVDIVFPKARVAVDVRGCWWHRCPEHASRPAANAAWWDSKLESNARRDADTEARLAGAGWTTIVVWEHEPPAAAADRVEAAVR